MTYDEHVKALAAEHGITVDERSSTRGMAFADERRIRITAVRGPVSYATALHEIGHIVAEGASGRKHSRLIKEWRAWRWARSAALQWSDRMDAEMQRSIRSYLNKARRCHWPIPPEVWRDVESA